MFESGFSPEINQFPIQGQAIEPVEDIVPGIQDAPAVFGIPEQPIEQPVQEVSQPLEPAPQPEVPSVES